MKSKNFMKISKKIIGMLLCTLISVGGSQINLLQANAQQDPSKVDESKVKWKQGLRLKVRDKNNPLRTDW